MTIEIHQPELEAIIHERMASGEFANIEDILLQALRTLVPSRQTDAPPANDLDAMFAEIRGLADDLDFSRIPSTDRPVDL